MNETAEPRPGHVPNVASAGHAVAPGAETGSGQKQPLLTGMAVVLFLAFLVSLGSWVAGVRSDAPYLLGIGTVVLLVIREFAKMDGSKKLKAGRDGVEVSGEQAIKGLGAGDAQDRYDELAGVVEEGQRYLDESQAEQLAVSDPEKLWSVAVALTKKDELEAAREAADKALELSPENTKYLLASGHIARLQEDFGRGIDDMRRLVAVLEGDGDPKSRERLHVGYTNLAFLMAIRGKLRNRDEALQLAERAAAAVDDFHDRDSFVINFGYTKLMFARDPKEWGSAVDELARCLCRDLKDQEVDEVIRYLHLAHDRLDSMLDGV